MCKYKIKICILFCFCKIAFGFYVSDRNAYGFSGYKNPFFFRAQRFIRKDVFDAKREKIPFIAQLSVLSSHEAYAKALLLSPKNRYIPEPRCLFIESFNPLHGNRYAVSIDPNYLSIDVLGDIILDAAAISSITYVQDNRSKMVSWLLEDIDTLKKGRFGYLIPSAAAQRMEKEYIYLKMLPKKQMISFIKKQSDFPLDILPLIYSYIATSSVRETPYPISLLKQYV